MHGNVFPIAPALRPLPQAELEHLRYLRRELINRNSPADWPFLAGQIKSPRELVEQQRAIRALIISTALAVVVSFGALVAANVFLFA